MSEATKETEEQGGVPAAASASAAQPEQQQAAGKAARLEKAAIVLLSLGEDVAAKVLRCLDRDGIKEISQAMARLSGVKNETVRVAMQEFFDDYREQSGIHGASRSYLKRSLDLALGPNIAGSVLNSIYGDAIRPKMTKLQWASAKWLADHIVHEHETMQAVFLSFLPSGLAADVVDELPEAKRDTVLLAVAHLKDVDSDLLVELDQLVDNCLEDFGTQGTEIDGVKQAAEIINRMRENRRQMEVLRVRDSGMVDAIENKMYDFFILSRQTDVVLTRIIEEIPLEQWAIALKGADPAVRNAIRGAMPKRQTQTFDDQMKRSGPVPLSRVEQVRAEIMSEVKALAYAGDIELQLFHETTVE